MLTQVGPKILKCEGAILRAKRGGPRTYPDMSGSPYTQSDSAGAKSVQCGCHVGLLDRGAHGATQPGEYD